VFWRNIIASIFWTGTVSQVRNQQKYTAEHAIQDDSATFVASCCFSVFLRLSTNYIALKPQVTGVRT
jgi:hypothetical protein